MQGKVKRHRNRRRHRKRSRLKNENGAEKRIDFFTHRTHNIGRWIRLVCGVGSEVKR